ncbi:glycosyltransferase family 39 protein, partial [Candidatus Peregrinibacteria bacterium]|nr:glycosyltransferase family 39 protein [Candidatus Peregrinibacteria bacterium]
MRRWFPFALLVLFPAIVFLQTLSFEFVAMDDELLILDNVKVHGLSLANLRAIFTTYDPELYIPLTLLTYQIEWSLFGANPAVSHAMNLLLHIGSGICVFLILRRFIDRKTALLCALLFAIHPLQAETVAWASARKDLLSGFLFFLSIHLYLRSRDDGMPMRWSVLTFFLGLLSKVSIFPLPLVLLLLDWMRGESLDRDRLKEKIPFFLLSVTFLVIAILGKHTQMSALWIPILLSPTAIFLALKHFFVPTDLSIFYPFTDPVSVAHPAVLFHGVVLLVVAVLIVWSLRYTRLLAGGFLLFLFMIAPSLVNMLKGGGDGAFDVYLSSDRYVYGAMLG